MEYTPNLNLKKPDRTDPVLIGDLNYNMDILDQAIKGIWDILSTGGGGSGGSGGSGEVIVEFDNFMPSGFLDEVLIRSTPTALSVARQSLAGASVGDYVLFAGGYDVEFN